MDSVTLNQQIIQAYEDVIRKEKIVIHLEHLRIQQREQELTLAKLRNNLNKEEKDYLTFDKKNVRNLFLQTLGTHKDKLEKEKQEYLMAYMQYNDFQKSIDRLYEEEKILKEVLYNLFDAEKRLDQLLLEKRKTFSDDKEVKHQRIFELEQRIIRFNSKINEIQEAIDAGEQVRPILKKIVAELKEIKKWGFVDYAGKGRYSSYKKKKYIDAATQKVFEVNLLLQKFETELHDVSNHYNLQYEKEVTFFKGFVDVFLNNLVTDWVIQKKINNSIAGISTTIDRVKMVLLNLEEEIHKTKTIIAEYQDDIMSLLLEIAQNDGSKS